MLHVEAGSKCFIDIGAYRGDATISWLEKHPTGKAYCIEPSPENIEALNANFSQDPRVCIIPSALFSARVAAQPDSCTGGKKNGLVFGPGSIEHRHVAACQIPGNQFPQYPHHDPWYTWDEFLKKYEIQLEICEVSIDSNLGSWGLLRDIIAARALPNRIYMHDVCPKTVDMIEWCDRLHASFFIQDSPTLTAIVHMYCEPDALQYIPESVSSWERYRLGGEWVEYVPWKSHFISRMISDPLDYFTLTEKYICERLVSYPLKMPLASDRVLHYCASKSLVIQLMTACIPGSNDLLEVGIRSFSFGPDGWKMEQEDELTSQVSDLCREEPNFIGEAVLRGGYPLTQNLLFPLARWHFFLSPDMYTGEYKIFHFPIFCYHESGYTEWRGYINDLFQLSGSLKNYITAWFSIYTDLWKVAPIPKPIFAIFMGFKDSPYSPMDEHFLEGSGT